MTLSIVTFCYGLVVVLALGLLHTFGALRWYWHALGLAAALTLGSMPMHMFRPWGSPTFDLTLGSVIVFLLVWGVAAPFFRDHHSPVHHH
jgi:hypothetical protein